MDGPESRRLRLVWLAIQPFVPADNGGRQRSLGLVRAMAQRHDVRVVLLHGGADGDGARAEIVDLSGGRRAQIAALPTLLHEGLPPRLRHFAAPAQRTAVEQLVRQHRADVVIADTPFAMGACAHLSVPLIVNTHNVEAELLGQPSIEVSGGRLRARLDARFIPPYERRALRRADGAAFCSRRDLETLWPALRPGARSAVVPNAVDVDALRPLAAPDRHDSVVFVGKADFAPNHEAVSFIRDRLAAGLAEAGVTAMLVGEDGDDAPGVRHFGRVPDVSSYYERSFAAVVPLFSGSGTRLKVLEALALGRPVVATAKAVEGLGLVDGVHYLGAETPAEFLWQLRLLHDGALWTALVAEGRALVEARFSWRVAGDAFESLVQQVAARPPTTRASVPVRRRPVILAVLPDLPHPPYTGAHTRPLSLLRALHRDHTLIVVGVAPEGADLHEVTDLVDDLIVLRRDAWQSPSRRKPLAAARRALTPVPLSLTAARADLAAAVRSATRCVRPSAVHLESMATWSYRQPGVVNVLDLLDVMSTLCASAFEARPVRNSPALAQYALERWVERCVLPRFDTVIAINESDAAHLRGAGAKVVTIPLALPLPPASSLPPADLGRRGPIKLLFVGNFGHEPNRAAVMLLEREVAPLLASHSDGFDLTIAGAGARPMTNHANQSLHYVADVPDLGPLYAAADIVLAPARHGGGTKNKTIEAMGWRRPIVGTPQAFTGITAHADEAYVCVPYSGRCIADAVLSLMSDPDRRARLARSAREYVVAFHGQAIVDTHIAQLYAELLRTSENRDLGQTLS